MSHRGGFKERLSELLPLSLKLALKRAAVGPAVRAARLAERARGLADRALQNAAAQGLDLHANNAPQQPPADDFGLRDFLLLTDAAADKRPADSSPGGAVRASVVVAVGDDAELTFRCLRSLLREVERTDAEVIVVAGDAAGDETRRLLALLGGLIKVVECDAAAGRAESRNRGAAAARGPLLVFLGGDAAVLPGWLGNLLDTAERDDKVGAVGPVFLGPDGRVREAGAIIWQTGEVSPYGRGESPAGRRFNFAREVDYCSGASLLVRKDLFDRLGGFDPGCAPYEDADICMGARAHGFKVVYQPLARVVRYETAGGAADGAGEGRLDGGAKFREKWKDALATEHLPPRAEDAEPAANRRWATQVAVFDDLIPTPDRDAGSARMMFILRAINAWAHPVFVTTGKRLWPEYEKLLWREGIETASALELKQLIARRNFRAAVLSRPAVAGALLPSVRRAAPRLRIVYDMLDVHHLRAEREAALTGDARAAREADKLRRLETRLARAADLVWCGSAPDKEIMARLAPGVPSVVIPTVHELHGRGLPFAGRAHLLFVGNFSHRPNVDAVHFTAREVLPVVRRTLPDVELLVVGDNAPPEFAAYAAEGVRLLGYVPSLDPVMSGCRVFVAPIRFGSGVNGKIGEALSYGLPAVTTTVGAEGWGFTPGEQVLIEDAPGDFAAAVLRLYENAELWQRLSDSGYRHIAENNTPEVIGRVINDSLRGGALSHGGHARADAADS